MNTLTFTSCIAQMMLRWHQDKILGFKDDDQPKSFVTFTTPLVHVLLSFSDQVYDEDSTDHS